MEPDAKHRGLAAEKLRELIKRKRGSGKFYENT